MTKKMNDKDLEKIAGAGGSVDVEPNKPSDGFIGDNVDGDKTGGGPGADLPEAEAPGGGVVDFDRA